MVREGGGKRGGSEGSGEDLGRGGVREKSEGRREARKSEAEGGDKRRHVKHQEGEFLERWRERERRDRRTCDKGACEG